jgi:hypothetical protein
MQPCQGTKLPQGSIAEIFQFEVGMAAVVLLSFATGIDVVPKPHRTCDFPVISFFYATYYVWMMLGQEHQRDIEARQVMLHVLRTICNTVD